MRFKVIENRRLAQQAQWYSMYLQQEEQDSAQDPAPCNVLVLHGRKIRSAVNVDSVTDCTHPTSCHSGRTPKSSPMGSEIQNTKGMSESH